MHPSRLSLDRQWQGQGGLLVASAVVGTGSPVARPMHGGYLDSLQLHPAASTSPGPLTSEHISNELQSLKDELQATEEMIAESPERFAEKEEDGAVHSINNRLPPPIIDGGLYPHYHPRQQQPKEQSLFAAMNPANELKPRRLAMPRPKSPELPWRTAAEQTPLKPLQNDMNLQQQQRPKPNFPELPWRKAAEQTPLKPLQNDMNQQNYQQPPEPISPELPLQKVVEQAPPKPLRTRVENKASLYDLWWENRRAQNSLLARDGSPTPMELPDALQLDVESVSQVLTEFVQSDYILQMCSSKNIKPTDYGEIGGMFEFVKIPPGSNRIIVRLKRVFNERNGNLLDRLAKYLRARIPQITEIHARHREGVDIY